MATSPTKRTTARLRKLDWTYGITEHWNPFAHIRQDLFGFADIIAFNDDETILIQCTTKPNISARVKKIMANEKAMRWLRREDRRIQVWGWEKGARGDKALRTVEIEVKP